MSFREDISTLHASDLASGGRVSPRGQAGESRRRMSPKGGSSSKEKREARKLRTENEHLRLCLRLMREQTQLQSANLISSVIAWCDDTFRMKFAEMSLGKSSRTRSVSPFRPISPAGKVSPAGVISPTGYISPAGHISPAGVISPAGHISPAGVISPTGKVSPARVVSPAGYISPRPQNNIPGTYQGQGFNAMDSTFSKFGSPLTASQLVSGLQGSVMPGDPLMMAEVSRSKSPGQRPYSPTGSVHRDTQSSGTGTLSNAGISGQGHQSFTSGRVSPVAGLRAPSPGSPYSVGARTPLASPAPRQPSPNSSFGPDAMQKFGVYVERPSPVDGGRSRSPSPAFNYTANMGPDRGGGNFARTVPAGSGSYTDPPRQQYNSFPGTHIPGPHDVYERPLSPPSGRASPVPSRSGRTSPVPTQLGRVSPVPSRSGRTSPVQSRSGRTSPVPSRSGRASPVPNTRSKSPHSISSYTSSQPAANPNMQYNHTFGNPSARFPREEDVSAAFNSPMTGTANFSATLESRDITGLQSLTRPDSSPFIPSGLETGTKDPQYVSGVYQSPRDGVFSPTGSAFPPAQMSHQEYFANATAPPPSPAPPGQYYQAAKDKPGRSLTPVPEMQTRALPGNMSALREEMEQYLPPRGQTPSPVPSRSGTPNPQYPDRNAVSRQLFGQPLAASTPKRSRAASPSGSKSHRVRSPSGVSKTGRKSKRSPARTPSPRSRRSPSPMSDDSFKAQSRRSATLVRPSHRILGEIAFQLERRILDYVFSRQRNTESRERGRRRFYGYTVSNIPLMILKESQRHDGTVDDQVEFRLKYRLKYVLASLAPFGYDLDLHGVFAQEMINKYGLLSNAPDRKTLEAFGLADADTLREFVVRLAHNQSEKREVLILLECLFVMAHDDGRAIFLW